MHADNNHRPALSIVVPLFNEAESLEELQGELDNALTGSGLSFEVIYVDDGSSDGSWEIIKGLEENSSRLRGIKLGQNRGKTAALLAGFNSAKGEVVVTLDADLQDDPAEIPHLYRMIANEGYHLVSGWRAKRNDPPSKRVPARIYNLAVKTVTGINLHDFNCGLKAYKAEVVRSLKLRSDMHRYTPVLAKLAGFDRIGEKRVRHRRRKYGFSKYGPRRFFKGAVDFITIIILSLCRKMPGSPSSTTTGCWFLFYCFFT